MEEIWKDIVYDDVTYEGYRVSNWGEVKNLNYRNTGRERVMQTSKNNKGYLQVCLRKDGKPKTFYVHRLVASTFIPNPENKPQVNHKIEGDEGKTMNFVFFNEDGSVDEEKTTIEWSTSEENVNYGTRNERTAKSNTNGKKSKKVLQFTLDEELVREWESTNECRRNGFSQGLVAACCRGERKTHKGFKWEYK